MRMENRPERVTLGKLMYRHRKSAVTSRSPCEIIAARSEPYQSLEMPVSAMEFLCRSWTPSASAFLQSFSLHPNQSSTQERQREGKDHNTHQSTNCTHVYSNPGEKYPKMKIMKGLKDFLSLGREFGWRKKEETRLACAKIHAALSVAQLAAAIAGYIGAESNQLETAEVNMRSAVAYAAAMVATACAESAASTSAEKVRVAYAVNSGMQAQSPADFITLVANAATSLRGVATLESRKVPASDKSSLFVILPSGERFERTVSFYTKHGKVKLVMEKKCVGFVWKRSEFIVLHAETESRCDGAFTINIRCDRGDVRLMFPSEQQMKRWMAKISHALGSI